MGVSQGINLKEEPSFGYSYVKVHHCDSISIKFFTTCEWQVTLLDIIYEMYWLLNIMFAKLSKLYAVDAACYVLNTKFILLTKKSDMSSILGKIKD